MIDFDYELRGFKDAEFFLATLAPKVRKRVIKQSLRRGAVVLQKGARGNVAVRSGELRKSIKVRTGRTLKVQVYADSGNNSKNDGWYAHLVERGVKPHSVASGSRAGNARIGRNAVGQDVGRKHPGFKGSRFMERSLDANVGQAVQAVAERFETLLLKEISR